MLKIKKRLTAFSETDKIITEKLYLESGVSHVIGFVLAILLAVATLKSSSNPTRQYIWIVLISAAYLIASYLSWQYKLNNQPSLAWLNKLRLSVLFKSIAWSLSCFLVFEHLNQPNQTIIFFALVGLCSGAAMVYSIDIVLLFLFLVPISISLILRLFIENSTPSIAMGMMTLLFLIFALGNGRKNNQSILQNIKFAQDSRSSEVREKAHRTVMEMLANKKPLPEVLNAIVLGLEELNSKMICSIILLDADDGGMRIGAAPSLPNFYNDAVSLLHIGPSVGSCGTAMFLNERVIVEDIQSHPYWEKYREIAAKANLAACWSEPIRDSSGNVLGSLAIYHRTPTFPSDSDVHIITQNAYLASMAIELTNANNEQQLASLLYENTNESMMVCDANNLIVAVNPAFTRDTGYSAREALGKNPRILSSGLHTKVFFKELWKQLEEVGSWQGEIWNRKKNGDIYAEWIRINRIADSNGKVLNYLSLSTDVTKKKESENTIWKQANFDGLTGLPNRRMFQDRFLQEIKRTQRSNLPLALLFIDLDEFKEVNDALGHHVGDKLLKEAAKRLISCVRESDTVSHEHSVARLGGDEFTIILSEIKDVNAIERVAQRILDKMVEPYHLDDDVVYISASIGITIYPIDSTKIETLLKNADQAMYAAKREGRNRFAYFTESMQLEVQNRLRLTNDLRVALERKEFFLLYQPIVNLSNNHIHKAEALIRWQHPVIGLISPAEFIPIAEDSGLINEIGNWVFMEASKQVVKWRKSLSPDFQISINKSPVQFYNTVSGKGKSRLNWIEHLKTLKLPGQSIALEITERLLLDTNTGIRNQLLDYRDAGIQVSLDDFGTGYSSLAYLKKLDIDYIKIDQSFVRNLEAQSEDMALCEAIIVMAHKLNLKVIAEGIETKQQLDLLKLAGCDFGQGYYFSRPVPPKEFVKLIRQV